MNSESVTENVAAVAAEVATDTLDRVITNLIEVQTTLRAFLRGTNGAQVDVDVFGNVTQICELGDRRKIESEIDGITIAVNVCQEFKDTAARRLSTGSAALAS